MAIQRLNYFNGQFLREKDFNDEQGYHLSMRRMHNKNAHTPGIVYGLEVVAGTSPVIVKAGMAIDKDGREIVLETDTPCAISAGNNNFYVVIALEEKKTDKAVATDPIKLETRWTESPVFNVVAAVPAGAVALAQIAAVAGNGAVTLNSAYRRICSAPVVKGDLTVGRDLTVHGNLEVQGETTLIETDQMRGNVVLGDADTDIVTVEGTLVTGHSTGKLKIGSSVDVSGDITVSGNVVLGDADADIITVEGVVATGHSTGRLNISSPIDVTGDIVVSGNVDGRDVSADGAKLDSHAANTGNPHATTAVQVDTQGGTNRLATQINAGTGVIADARIDSAIARETRFNATTGHDHDATNSKKISPSSLAGVNNTVTAANLNLLTAGSTSNAASLHTHSLLDSHVANTSNPHATTAAHVDTQGGTNRLATQINAGTGVIADARIDSAIARETRFNATTGHDHDATNSKKISPSSLQGVNSTVTAAALNVLTGGATSNAAQLHTHPFVPDDNSVTLNKLDPATRYRLLRVPLLAQSLNPSTNISLGDLTGGIAFDGSNIWVANGATNTVIKIDPATNAGVTTVAVGSYPMGLAFGGGYLWVACWSNSSVSKIDVATNTVVATITVGSSPNALAVSGGNLWVANYYSNNVSKIDMASNTVVATVPVGSNPSGLAVVGSFLWAANLSSNSVSKIDMATNTVVATVSVGSQPRGLAAVTATFLWVANSGANTVSKVDVGSNTVVATVSVSGQPYGVAVIGSFLWVGGWGQVQKVDTSTNAVVATVPAYVGAWGNGMVSVTGFLWVSGSNQVTKIDVTANVVAATVLPGESRGMAFDGLYLWVALYGSGQVLKVDINTLQILLTVPVGTRPHSVAYNGSYIFVTNFGSNSVSKIDPQTGTVVATIPVGAKPAGIAFNPFYRTLWVANSGDGTVSVFSESATSVAGTVPVGGNPQGVACESYFVWVTNTGSNTVTKLGAWVGGSVQATITVGAAPQAIVFDYSSMWVANTGANSLSKIPANSNTPTSVPLPAGALPVKMCFNGTHVLVLCTNGQAYRIDIYTNAALLMPNSNLLGGAAGTNGLLAFDGVCTWAVDSYQLYRALV